MVTKDATTAAGSRCVNTTRASGYAHRSAPSDAMCAGALVLSRIDALFYGATDPKTGAVEPFLDPDSAVRARAVASLGRVRNQLAPPDGRGVTEHIVDITAQVMDRT